VHAAPRGDATAGGVHHNQDFILQRHSSWIIHSSLVSPGDSIPSVPAAIAITITVAIATTIVAAAAVVVATLPRHLSRRAGFWIKCYIREEPPGYY